MCLFTTTITYVGRFIQFLTFSCLICGTYDDPLPVQKEDKMNTGRPKGNQKHLDLSARIIIEQHLNNGDSFRSIAIELSKDPSTISKEIRRHSIIRERSADAFAPIPVSYTHLDVYKRQLPYNGQNKCPALYSDSQSPDRNHLPE